MLIFVIPYLLSLVPMSIGLSFLSERRHPLGEILLPILDATNIGKRIL